MSDVAGEKKDPWVCQECGERSVVPSLARDCEKADRARRAAVE